MRDRQNRIADVNNVTAHVNFRERFHQPGGGNSAGPNLG
jgi:hypothetical protein